MASDPFLEQDFRVLTPEAFDFVLKNELKRAIRSQNFVTLVLIEPVPRGASGEAAPEREQAARLVARLISREIRETDLVSQTAPGELSVVLLDADLPHALGVVDRLMAWLEHYEFPAPLTFEVGVASCPTHGVDAETLRRAAESRPIRTRGHRYNAQ